VNPSDVWLVNSNLYAEVVNSIESVWATAYALRWGDSWVDINLHLTIRSTAEHRLRSSSYYDAIKLVEKHYDTTGD